MKLKMDRVSIMNFKNYKGEITFDLSKKVTILHGDNGFGKSTFFDAVEWCLTNNIDRYNGSDKEIKNDIVNRSSDLSQLRVSVEIEFSGNKLLRYFDVTDGQAGNTQVIFIENNGTKHRGQKKVEETLKSESFEGIEFERGAYGRLIKRTYILSQDQVTEFINSEDASDRYRGLANIMGLKSILNETDNAKKVLSALKVKKEQIESELQGFENTIKSKEELKRNIDIYSLNTKLAQLGIDLSEKNLDEECRKIENRLMTDKNGLNRFAELYKKLNLDNDMSVKGSEKQIKQYQNKKSELKIKVKKREQILTELETQISELQYEKINIEKFNKIRLDIRENEEILEKLGIDDDNIENINKEMNLLRDNAFRLEYHLSIQESLNLNKKKIQELKTDTNLLENRAKKIKRRSERITHIEKNLSLIIDKSKNKVMAQLLSNIKDIKSHVSINNLIECPVCSSIPEQGLEENIDKNVVLLNTKLQKDTLYLEKCLNTVKKVRRRLDEFRNEENNISSTIKGNNLNLNRLTEEVQHIKSNSLYNSKYETYSQKRLNDKLDIISKSINSLQDSVNILLTLNKLRNQLSNTKQDESNVTNPRKKNEIIKQLEKSIISKNRISTRLSNNLNKIEELEDIIRNAESNVYKIKESISADDINKTFGEILSANTKLITRIDVKLSELSILKGMSSDLKLNKEIEQQINDIRKEKSIHSNVALKVQQIVKSLDEYLIKNANRFGDRAKDFLNKENSSIQRYFRYLNPLPSNSILTFEGGEEELNIKINFDNEHSSNTTMSNAKNVLSSGQLNVLAISIFLAINEGQKTHSLDFVAIDDPIQNMDDVNQYSICDVLGSVEKQLLISTHDIEFLKLFIKKNEHRKEDIQVYSFMSPYLDKNKVNRISF